MLSHDGVLLIEVQAQPAGAITPTVPIPPVAGTEPVLDCRL